MKKLRKTTFLILIFIFAAGVKSVYSQSVPEAYFPVFIQSVMESDSHVVVQLAFTETLKDSAWVAIIQEVSSTVDFQNDIIFTNPFILRCSAGDSLVEFSIGIVDDNEMEIAEQIMLAIESTSDNIATGMDGEHVVFIYDNDCELSWDDEIVLCTDDPPFELNIQPEGGEFEGENMFGNFFYPGNLSAGVYEVSYMFDYEGICSDTILIEIEVNDCNLSNTTELHLDKRDWQLYPNPAYDRIFIRIMDDEISKIDDCEFRVIDISGRLVKTMALESDSSLDISDLQNGLYTLSIRSNKGFSNRKFVKL